MTHIENIHYALCDVEELATGIFPVCVYGDGEDEDAAEHAVCRGGFVLKLNGATSWYGKEVTVDYVAAQVSTRPGDIVDQVRLQHRAAGLAVKLLTWIVDDYERQIARFERTLGRVQEIRDRRDVAERAHDAVVAMIRERSAA